MGFRLHVKTRLPLLSSWVELSVKPVADFDSAQSAILLTK